MSVLKLIEEDILKQETEKPHREKSGKFKPSNFGRCYRLQVLARLDYPISNPPDIKSLKRMEEGTNTHKLNQSHLPPEICEIPIETEDILGRADIVLPDCVYDIKCQEEYQIKRYWNKPIEVLLNDKFTNWLQVGWYGVALNKPFVGIFPCVYGMFIALKHRIPIEAIKEDVEKEVTQLKEFWECKILPPACPRAYNGRDCQYCAWQITCVAWEKEKKVIDFDQLHNGDLIDIKNHPCYKEKKK